MQDIATTLRERGRVTGASSGLVSLGKAFRRLSERRARERKRAQYLSDRERLRELGGRPRSEAEEREFRALLRDPHLPPAAYFEKRLWEKSRLAALTSGL
ncbi:hypothetical protein [Ensifer sp. LCM 4579]|uniref:hypothetical protein n=1 Tax=Ensifer sp. LCM 4579 TaxID=1848292 RepID=UPI0008D92D4C|nr:hypothetical protein [Ensifer sp. LCM 4579]OHV85931.1 hypothetical protein LCM4579_00790 [Ensifer sp. LCM 4579]